MSMTVDSKGSDIERRSHSRKCIVINEDAYKNFMFELGFPKGEGSGKCSLHCNEAFDHTSTACATVREYPLSPR